MKKAVLILFLFYFISLPAFAAELSGGAPTASTELTVKVPAAIIADTAKKDTLHCWRPTGSTGFNVSQISFTNWSQGGDNSITWSVFLYLALSKDFSNFKFKNQLKTDFGMTKAGKADFKNNENEFFLENVLSYKLAWKIDPFFSNSIRTVIAHGFDYSANPKKQISKFFDPGYITQSLGFTYEKVKGFSTRLGLALQETFTDQFRQYTNENEPYDKWFKFETGLEEVTSYDHTFAKSLHYQGRLRLFTRFNQLDVWDVRFDNILTAKITKFINVNFTALMVHEISQTRRTQFKEGLQLGFVYNLFK